MEWQDTRSEWTIDEGGEEDEGEYRRKKRRLYTEEYDYADKNCYSSSSEEEEEEEREENDDISLSEEERTKTEDEEEEESGEESAEEEEDSMEAELQIEKPKEFFEWASVYLAAEFCADYLDLSDILALHQVSKATRATFRTPLVAFTLIDRYFTNICEEHTIDIKEKKPDETKTKTDEAWLIVDELVHGVVWHTPTPLVCCETKNNGKKMQTIRGFHLGRCAIAHKNLSSEERLDLLQRELDEEGLQIRDCKEVCALWVRGKHRINSLAEVVAMVDNARFIWEQKKNRKFIGASEIHERTRVLKYENNVSWAEAVDAVQKVFIYCRDDEDEDDLDLYLT